MDALLTAGDRLYLALESGAAKPPFAGRRRRLVGSLALE
jgi:hypothetical protein